MTASSSLALFTLWALLLTLKLFTAGSFLMPLLLILEALMLVTLLAIGIVTPSPASLFLIFFTLAVCEACLGLGVLIATLRQHGTDTINACPTKLKNY